MPAATFEVWWEKIRRDPSALSDPHAAALRLSGRLGELPAEDHAAFLDDLLRFLLRERFAYGVTLFLLQGISDPAALDVIARHLSPLPERQSDEEEAHLADLIRILAATNLEQLGNEVSSYLTEREIGPYWSSVPWALWPHQPELFANAWARFLEQQQPECFDDLLVVRSFLGEPQAIPVVRRKLPRKLWRPFREALRREESVVRWLSDEQRTELRRILT